MPDPRTLRLACLDGNLDEIIPEATAYDEARKTGATVETVTDAEALERISVALDDAGIAHEADRSHPHRFRIIGPGVEAHELVLVTIDPTGFATMTDYPHGEWDAPFVVASLALREGFEEIRDGLVKGLETR